MIPHVARARRALMRRDPRLAALMTRVGACDLGASPPPDAFASLVRVILSQQLSSKAADTIFGRVESLAARRGGLTAPIVARLDAEALRAAGVSRQKTAALYDLADQVASGRLDLDRLSALPDDEVVARITAVKGLGVWSAEMFLMFRLTRLDILPVGDLGIVKGIQVLHGLKRRPAASTMRRLAEPWRPYRSVACWYLWRI
jgi:3-methyladenine DNA glycosylase/8-oxoguanine DNA glycosylase